MALENKFNIFNLLELAEIEERISKKKAANLFENGLLDILEAGTFASLKICILKQEIGKVVDWSKVDKEDYLLAMERSPIRDIEIKHVLKEALTDDIHSREVYMKGIDHSYYYEGYMTFKTEEL